MRSMLSSVRCVTNGRHVSVWHLRLMLCCVVSLTLSREKIGSFMLFFGSFFILRTPPPHPTSLPSFILCSSGWMMTKQPKEEEAKGIIQPPLNGKSRKGSSPTVQKLLLPYFLTTFWKRTRDGPRKHSTTPSPIYLE